MKCYLTPLLLSFWLIPSLASASGFQLNEMPSGARITLPQPATTIAPMGQEIMVSATDTGQVIKITLANYPYSALNIRVVHAENTIKVYRLTKEAPIIFSLKTFEKMFLTAIAEGGLIDGSYLKIQSNRPMMVQRGKRELMKTVSLH